MLIDQMGRAYGILLHAHSMNSKEALNFLSFIRLGVDLGFFPPEFRLPTDELFMETQPAHLQQNSQQKLSAEERDALRAEIVRNKLKTFPEPDFSEEQAADGSDGKGRRQGKRVVVVGGSRPPGAMAKPKPPPAAAPENNRNIALAPRPFPARLPLLCVPPTHGAERRRTNPTNPTLNPPGRR